MNRITVFCIQCATLCPLPRHKSNRPPPPIAPACIPISLVLPNASVAHPGHFFSWSLTTVKRICQSATPWPLHISQQTPS
jgi:hypothetical protein